MLSMRL